MALHCDSFGIATAQSPMEVHFTCLATTGFKRVWHGMVRYGTAAAFFFHDCNEIERGMLDGRRGKNNKDTNTLVFASLLTSL